MAIYSRVIGMGIILRISNINNFQQASPTNKPILGLNFTINPFCTNPRIKKENKSKRVKKSRGRKGRRRRRKKPRERSKLVRKKRRRKKINNKKRGKRKPQQQSNKRKRKGKTSQ